MSFDFIRDMHGPDNRTTPLQPNLLFQARKYFLGDDKNANDYFKFIERHANGCLKTSDKLLRKFELDNPIPVNIDTLPLNSWVIVLNFTLESPYIARDDAVFSATENPMRLEKIIGLPYVSPASWKGLLRGEFQGAAEEVVNRLFGTDPGENDENDDNLRGRLCFFPTFFKKLSLDMINPHKRETKTDARGPLKFEIVPANCKGQFKIVYIPFGNNCDLKTTLSDLQSVADGLRVLFCNSGISAKRNIGYGIIEEQFEADSFFQINNEAFIKQPALESEKKDLAIPENLIQDTGEIVPYEEFCNKYSKAECERNFGKKDRKQVYKQLAASIRPVDQKKVDECLLQKYSVTRFEDIASQIATLREAIDG